MSKQTIQHGLAPGDDGGEYLYYAFKKCNENFTELYNADVTIAAAAATAQSTANGKEDNLGNPAANGYILSSTTAGVRSWIPAPSGGGGAVDSVNGNTGTVVLTGADIGVTATGDVSATTVQGAIAELAAEKATTAALAGKEDDLGNPAANGYILSSTTGGVRSWIPAPSGGGAVDSVNGYTGTVTLAKGDVGLSNVDNTSDTNKPVSAAQAAALYAGDSEHTSAGVLVYPSNEPQTLTYNSDGTVDTFTCSYGGYTWTLAMTTYDANGNVTLMTADDGAGGHTWTRTLAYNADNTLATDGGWV